MPEPTLLTDVIQPAWLALTPEQRICWHFWAAANPLVDNSGRLRTLYGAQSHYHKNADIAVTLTNPLLVNPPTTATPPSQVAIVTVAWPLQSRLDGTTTARGGVVYLSLDDTVPLETAIIVRQGYDAKLIGNGRPPRIRHINIIQPLATGDVSLQDPSGYFATTLGVNKFASIKGRTAQRRPDKPLGTVRVVNLLNGQTVRQVLKNPYAGSRKKTNRARATSAAPTSPTNHYP